MSAARPAIQSTIGPARLHPVWVVSAFVNGVRNSIALFIGVGLSLRSQSGLILLTGMIALLLAILGVRIIQWMRITYEATNGTVTLRSGVLSRIERVIPVERVQNVNTVATPIDRLFGTLQLAIETAGTGERLTLETLSRSQAADLERWIDIERGGPAGVEQAGVELPAPAHDVLHVVSGRDVLVAGLTSGRVGPAMALLAAAFRFGTDFLPERYWNRLPFEPDNVSVRNILVLLIVSALIAWTLSVVSAVVSYWQFTLSRHEDALTITTGLLDRRQITIPLARIQAISIVEGPLQQPFGYAAVMIESASRHAAEGEAAGSQSLVPIIQRAHIPDLLARAAPEYKLQSAESLHPLPNRARRRYLIAGGRNGVLLVAVALALFTVLPGSPWWYGLGLLPIVPVMLIYGYLQFRDAGWAMAGEDQVLVRRRTLDRITTIAPRRRVQIRSVSQSLFQRRAGLATLGIRLGARSSRGSMSLVHIDSESAMTVAQQLGPVRKR